MEDPEVVEDKSGYIPKAKRQMSEAQLAALAKARQKAYEIRQSKKNVINIDSNSEEEEGKEAVPEKPEPKAKKSRKPKPKQPIQQQEAMKAENGESSDDDEACCAAAAPTSPLKSCLRKCSHRNVYLYYEDD